MRSVRCDACGAKAMTAAAKCPKCSHLLDLRDGFGELLPLAYCSSCDSYYPERHGECKWCGTKPERPPINPKIWRGIGAGLAAVLGAVWVLNNASSTHPEPQRQKQVAKGAAPAVRNDTVAVTPKRVQPQATVAMASDDSLSPATDSAAPPPIVLPQASPPAAEPVSSPSGESPAPQIVAAPEPSARVSTAPAPATRRQSRWVRSVSRDWVVIRRGASKGSKIVASIGPNSRVELGESRGGWRRLRTKGVAGWVEPRNLFEVARAR